MRTGLEKDLDTLERGLFGRHKPYCSHEKKWWQRRPEHGPCVCDDLRDALARVREAVLS